MSWQNREMSPIQFGLAIARLELSQAAAARFLGVTARQVRRYVAGEREVPVTTVLLLRNMIQHGDVPEVPKRPKGRSY